MRSTRAAPIAPAALALLLAAAPAAAHAGVVEPPKLEPHHHTAAHEERAEHHERSEHHYHRSEQRPSGHVAEPARHRESAHAHRLQPPAAATATIKAKPPGTGKAGGKPSTAAKAAKAAKAARKYEPPDPHKGTATGLPLPRFAALRSDDVNLRIGPGTRYPIEWVYKRRELPVEIEREFEVWRLVEDPEGVKGWVHQATLTGRRSFVVKGPERVLRERPDDHSYPVARLQPGVVGRILHCDAGSAWCRVQAGDYRGWLKRSEFWGTLAGEAID